MPSVRSANLSALKKRWEQPSAPPPSQPVPLAPPRPAALLQGGQAVTRRDRQPLAGGQASQGEAGMNKGELALRERPEASEEPVPSSPRASYEKPLVPLNNLKMKFERGAGAPSKVIKDAFTHPHTPPAETLHSSPSPAEECRNIPERRLSLSSEERLPARSSAFLFATSIICFLNGAELHPLFVRFPVE